MSNDKDIATLIEQVRWMSKELREIKMDVKHLIAFKWRILGFAAGSSAVAAFLATTLIEIAKGASK